MEINVFDNNAVYALIPQNSESGEPDMENIGDKFEFVLHNNLMNSG